MMRLCETIGEVIERACSRWPGPFLALFYLACYVVGALIDGGAQ